MLHMRRQQVQFLRGELAEQKTLEDLSRGTGRAWSHDESFLVAGSLPFLACPHTIAQVIGLATPFSVSQKNLARFLFGIALAPRICGQPG
jgi:hypothetical protein